MLLEGTNLWQKIRLDQVESLSIQELEELRAYINKLIDDYERGRRPRRLINVGRPERVLLDIEVEVRNENEARYVRLDIVKVDESSGRSLIVFEPIGAKSKSLDCESEGGCVVWYRVSLLPNQVVAVTKPSDRGLVVRYYLVGENGLLPITSSNRDVFAFVKGEINKIQTTNEEVIRV